MSRPWQEAKKYKQVLAHQLIEIRNTERGRGIFSLVDHKKDEAVAAFTGKAITIPTFDSEEAEEAFSKSADGEYSMSYAWDDARNAYLAISPDPATIGGHIANHSCDPNASVREKYRDALILRATRAIKAGEEITIDYHWQRRALIPCICGSDPCTGNIGLTYTLAYVPGEDGAIQTYLNFDRRQIVKLLQVAESHRNIDALRVLTVKGRFMRGEKLLEYFDEAFGSGRRDAWLSKNFHLLGKSPLSTSNAG
jgi:hypothetical protein